MNNKISRRVLAQVVASKLVAEPDRQTHWMRALAAFLLTNKMTDDAGLVLNDIAREIFDQNGQLLTTVTSARPLSDELRNQFVKYLKQVKGADKIHFKEYIDEDLLGGVVIRTPDEQFDGSVRTRLKQLAAIK